MSRRFPPYLRVVDEEPAQETSVRVEDLSWVCDAAAYVVDAAVDAVIEGAADYGMLFQNTTVLRQEIGAAVNRYVERWVREEIKRVGDPLYPEDVPVPSSARVYRLSDYRHA